MPTMAGSIRPQSSNAVFWGWVQRVSASVSAAAILGLTAWGLALDRRVTAIELEGHPVSGSAVAEIRSDNQKALDRIMAELTAIKVAIARLEERAR